MSNPVNPLDKFRSYAYHHVLVAASSTEAVRTLTDVTLSNEQQFAQLQNLELGKKKMVPNSSSGYYMICDTRHNSYFSITDFSYASTLSAGSEKYVSIMVGNVDLRIVDPSGIAFLNYMKFLTDEMQISLYNMTFVIKTIFIGHTYDGKVETVYQNAIPLLGSKMSISPSSQGSVIDWQMFPLNNALVMNNGNYGKMFDMSGVTSKTGKLKDAISSLENELNKASRKWYKSINLDILNSKGETERKEAAAGYGKLLQFMITVPDDWEPFTVSGIYGAVTESKWSRHGKKGEVTTKDVTIGFKVTQDTTIIEIIELILKQSKEVNDLASNKARKEKNLKAYVISTSMTSDDDSITVHFDILNYNIPDISDDSGSQTGKDSTSASKAMTVSEKGKMEFDYIFSGKNTDILNFQIKLDNVTLFISDRAPLGDKHTVETRKDQKDKTSDEVNSEKKDIVLHVKAKDAIAIPAKTGSQQSNMAYSTETDDRKNLVESRQQFIYNLGMAQGISSTNAIMQIRGNPDLFSRFSDPDVGPHVKLIDSVKDVNYVANNDNFENGTNGNYLSQSDVQNYKKYLVETYNKKSGGNFQTPQMYPFFIKINIFGQDFDALDKATSSNFIPYKKFWYDGYYFVKKIEHKFSGGNFTQDVLICANPADIYGKSVSDVNKQNTTTKG